MTTALVISGLVGFAAGVACMRPPRRKSRHGRASRHGAWRRIAGALLLISGKGVYARRDREEHPGEQETNSHRTAPA